MDNGPYGNKESSHGGTAPVWHARGSKVEFLAANASNGRKNLCKLWGEEIPVDWGLENQSNILPGLQHYSEDQWGHAWKSIFQSNGLAESSFNLAARIDTMLWKISVPQPLVVLLVVPSSMYRTPRLLPPDSETNNTKQQAAVGSLAQQAGLQYVLFMCLPILP